MAEMNEYSTTAMRVLLGALFIYPGYGKITAMLGEGHMLVDMLTGPGVWILGIAEVLLGIALLVGWKVRYTAWPLALVLVGAIVMVVKLDMMNLLFHLVGIAALAHIALNGAGPLAVDAE